MFNIEFEKFFPDKEQGDYFLSSITIGEFKEYMRIPVTYWTKRDYYLHWLRSLKVGVLNHQDSVLLTTMYNPNELNLINSWVLYSNKNNVYIQNKIIFIKEYENFSTDNINSYAGNREVITEDGFNISEWKLPILEIENFYFNLLELLKNNV